MGQTDPPEPKYAADARHVVFKGAAVDGAEAPSLEGRLRAIPGGALHAGAVLCHANPAAGGNMDMALMQAMEAALIERGIATLRYNSRGVGASAGAVSTSGDKRLVAPEGAAEIKDVGAALDFLAMQEGVDNRRLALVGHSFGARISLAYLAAHPEDDRIQGIACVGLPVAWRNLSYLGRWARPKLFVTGDMDDFCPPAQLEQFVAGLPEPATVVVLKGTGHFFEGRERNLADVVAEFLAQVLSAEC
jgi:uncharacterized protein